MSNEQGQVKNLNNVGKRHNGYKGSNHKSNVKLSPEERAALKAAKEAAAVQAEADRKAEEVRNFYANKRIRKGKTKRERASGAAHKNAQNRDSRASWQNDRRADGSNSTSFPVASCNGQRNRYQVTGKDGQTVYLRTASSATGSKRK